MTPEVAAPPRLQAQGWPRPALHGTADYVDLWHRHFGSGTGRVTLETEIARLDLIKTFALRRPALGSRFHFCPADRPFVAYNERRLIPLRQISPPISLEAGNLRGGLQVQAGASLPSAIHGLLATLSGQRGWDYLSLPIAASEVAHWTKAANSLMMPAIVRPTGRTFYANLSGRAGWQGRMASASRNDRKNETRALRRAEDAGLNLTAGPPAEIDFSALRRIADQSTKSARLQTAAVQVPYTALQESFLRQACRLPGNQGLMVRLNGPDGPLAASLWLRRGSDLVGTVTFHTEDARVFSPGLLLMREAFLWAQAHGVQSLDFNATDPLYGSYGDQSEAFHDLLVFTPGLKGRLLHRLALARDPGLAGKE